jgi:hypothetical protein
MLNDQTKLLIKVFQEAWPSPCDDPDPTNYVKGNRSCIKAAGRVFEYLGLAKSCKRSTLGWEPTERLLDLIAKRKARPSTPSTKPASIMETLTLDLMLDTMLGVEHSPPAPPGAFCCNVLIRLGLVVQHVHVGWTPSLVLLRLFADAYDMQRYASDPDAIYDNGSPLRTDNPHFSRIEGSVSPHESL